MDVKEAVQIAKTYVTELFSNEGVWNVGLEEVEFDDASNVWNVTVGFSRAWDRPPTPIAAIAQGASPPRSYKLVRINDAARQVISVKNRETKS